MNKLLIILLAIPVVLAFSAHSVMPQYDYYVIKEVKKGTKQPKNFVDYLNNNSVCNAPEGGKMGAPACGVFGMTSSDKTTRPTSMVVETHYYLQNDVCATCGPLPGSVGFLKNSIKKGKVGIGGSKGTAVLKCGADHRC